MTPQRTASVQAGPRSQASFVAEGSILTITLDLGCSADAEGPTYFMLYVTMRYRLYRLLLHHQENSP